MGVTGCRPQQPVNGETTSTAVADILHDTRQFTTPLTRQNQPAFNRLSTKPVVGHIEGFNQFKFGVDRREGRVQWELPCFSQCRLPERIKIGGLAASRLISL